MRTRQEVTSAAVYSLDGHCMKAGTSLDGLPKGIYVVGGKKVMR